MADKGFKGLFALIIIVLIGAIVMIVAGGTCIGLDPACHIPLDGSIAILVVGVVLGVASCVFGIIFFGICCMELAMSATDD
jgi:hypothetical protein